MIKREESITRELKILNNKIKRAADASIPSELKDEVTEVQCRVLGFLIHHADRDTFQRDVEADFSITRATASKLLAGMEHAGLITRSAVSGDARLKKLEPTARGTAIFSRMREGMMAFEESTTENFSPEERKTLLSLLRKLEENLDGKRGERG
jgi:MarR family transcriptional repressor of mepA